MREDEAKTFLEFRDTVDPSQTVIVTIWLKGISFRLPEETGIFILTRHQWEVIADAWQHLHDKQVSRPDVKREGGA